VNDCVSIQAALGRVMENPSDALPDELALHLDACDRCRRFFDRGRVELDPDDFEGLPPTGRARILRAIGSARAAGSRRLVASVVAAGLVLVAASLLYLGLHRSPSMPPVAAALVEDHIRYLNHPDRHGVLTSDRYEADLEAYVDFPVILRELPSARLTGARRCYLLGRRIALAFYDTPQGPASYFVLPAEALVTPGRRCTDDGSFKCEASHGFQIVSWEEAGLIHAFVGPDAAALLQLARACRANHAG
jgi:hypothetical protein